jgi:hypothetical protein
LDACFGPGTSPHAGGVLDIEVRPPGAPDLVEQPLEVLQPRAAVAGCERISDTALRSQVTLDRDPMSGLLISYREHISSCILPSLNILVLEDDQTKKDLTHSFEKHQLLRLLWHPSRFGYPISETNLDQAKPYFPPKL